LTRPDTQFFHNSDRDHSPHTFSDTRRMSTVGHVEISTRIQSSTMTSVSLVAHHPPPTETPSAPKYHPNITKRPSANLFSPCLSCHTQRGGTQVFRHCLCICVCVFVRRGRPAYQKHKVCVKKTQTSGYVTGYGHTSLCIVFVYLCISERTHCLQ
jgi:hypothetical protein